MGRPISTSFTPEERATICEHVIGQIAEGRSVARILAEDEGLCCYAVWAKWLRESNDLAESVARAREDGATKLIEEIVDISDDPNGDAYIAYVDGKPIAKIDGDTVQRAKLRVYAREKYAAMIAPRRYGPRLDLTSGGDKLPAPAAQDSRLDALLALAAHRAAHQLAPPAIEGELVDPLDEIMK